HAPHLDAQLRKHGVRALLVRLHARLAARDLEHTLGGALKVLEKPLGECRVGALGGEHERRHGVLVGGPVGRAHGCARGVFAHGGGGGGGGGGVLGALSLGACNGAALQSGPSRAATCKLRET